MSWQLNLNIQKSSGNIFADLGLTNAEARLVKAWIAMKINKIIEDNCLTQAKAGKVLGIKRSKVLALTNG